MKALWIVVVFSLTACSNSSPTAPTTPPPPPTPTCQTENTALVQFRNRSTTNLTYDIVWDGVRVLTLPPGQDSQKYTYAANVQHSVSFFFTNTTQLACATGTPILTTCSDVFYACGS